MEHHLSHFMKEDTPLKKLEKIIFKSETFDFTMTKPCDDRICTRLTLDDYDWMEYKFETWFPTVKQGMLSVKVIYYGMNESDCEITQKIDGKQYIHKISFDSDIFNHFLKDYLIKEADMIFNKELCFNGAEEAVELYNKIISEPIKYEIIDY